MTRTTLRESQTARKGKALLISEGVGSSGSYAAEMLQRDGASAFPSGTQLYYNHLGESETWERQGSHDIKDLIGVTTEAASWDEELRGLVAPIQVFAHAVEFVESVWAYVGLSIEAAGVVSEDGTVEALVYSPLNVVSLVPAAGRGGKIQGLYEGYQESYDKISNVETNPRKDAGMTPEDIQAVAEAITNALAPSFTAIQEALVPDVVEDPNNEVDIAAVAEAITVAGLPATSRAKVYEAVKNGTDVADAITEQKAFIAEVLKESAVDAAPGTISTTDATPSRVTVAGW